MVHVISYKFVDACYYSLDSLFFFSSLHSRTSDIRTDKAIILLAVCNT
jgi:hypothetical protein